MSLFVEPMDGQNGVPRDFSAYIRIAEAIKAEAERLAAASPLASAALQTVGPGIVPFWIESRGLMRPAPGYTMTPRSTPFLILIGNDVSLFPRKLRSSMFIESADKQRSNIVFVLRAKWRSWWLGLAFAHECVHRFEQVTGVYSAFAAPESMEHLLAEVRAHSAEHAILNDLTHGNWNTAVTEVIAAPELSFTEEGRSLRWPNQRGVQRVLATLPDAAASAAENWQREGSAVLSVAFAQCNSDRKKSRAYAHNLQLAARWHSDL